MQRIIINLDFKEWEALVDFAEKEHRPLRLQAEMIFRKALIERGIIKDTRRQFSRRARRPIVSRRKVNNPT